MRHLTRLHPDMPLYHWSPRVNRESIEALGLRISVPHALREPSLNGDGTPWYTPWICLGVTPFDALIWAGLPPGMYDLWQVERHGKDNLKSRRDGGPYIIEVRIRNNIAPSRLQRVATRKVD